MIGFFFFLFFFFNDTATTEIYTRKDTLSLHDALPICCSAGTRFSAASLKAALAFAPDRPLPVGTCPRSDSPWQERRRIRLRAHPPSTVWRFQRNKINLRLRRRATTTPGCRALDARVATRRRSRVPR